MKVEYTSELAVEFQHLSVSHANEFISYRAKWFAHRVMGMKFPFSNDMYRGSAVEAGIKTALWDDRNAPLQFCQEAALRAYDVDALGELDDLRETIPSLVERGIAEMKALETQHGPVVDYQRKLEHRLFGNGYMWLGYTDFTMEDGTTIDVKVSKQTKTSLSGAWGRQGAFYWEANGHKPVRFLAMTPLKTKMNVNVIDLPENQAPIFLGQLRDAERAISSILEVGPHKILGAFMPDIEGDFAWATPEARAIADSVWG